MNEMPIGHSVPLLNPLDVQTISEGLIGFCDPRGSQMQNMMSAIRLTHVPTFSVDIEIACIHAIMTNL